METMLAAQYLGPDRLEVSAVPRPRIQEGEALLAVEACGLCGSDLSIVAGTHPRARAPLTVGHELAARIVEIRAASTDFHVGDRVTMYPLISCGHCHACTHGNSHVCRELRLFGFDVDGGMAQYIRLPVTSLMRLPKTMPASVGALIEPLAVAVHGVGRTSLEAAETAVVLGAGPIGLLSALVAQARGVPRVLISDVLPARLELARQLGLQACKPGDAVREQVMQLTSNNGADVLFECAGHPSSAREMTDLVRSRGVVVNLGVFKQPVEVDMQAINFKEIDLLGSRVYERRDFQDAIDLAMRLPLAPMISHTFSIEEVGRAFQAFRSGEACKVLILPLPGVTAA